VKHQTGSYEEFKTLTLAVARGERSVAPTEPKIWVERIDSGTEKDVRFRSIEAGAKLLSRHNRVLLRAIAEGKPRSIAELAGMTGRAEQNVLRTLRKFADAGIVRMEAGEGRAKRPVLTARKVHFEIDLVAPSKVSPH